MSKMVKLLEKAKVLNGSAFGLIKTSNAEGRNLNIQKHITLSLFVLVSIAAILSLLVNYKIIKKMERNESNFASALRSIEQNSAKRLALLEEKFSSADQEIVSIAASLNLRIEKTKEGLVEISEIVNKYGRRLDLFSLKLDENAIDNRANAVLLNDLKLSDRLIVDKYIKLNGVVKTLEKNIQEERNL